jgi:hypothetical protein
MTMPPTARKDATSSDASKEDAAPEAKKESASSSSSSSNSGTEYLNTTSGWLVYDKDGHGIAGGEWTPAVNLDAVGKALRAANHLMPRSAIPGA